MVTVHAIDPQKVFPNVDFGESHSKSTSNVIIKCENWLKYLKNNPW
jgi:hypothetical protein